MDVPGATEELADDPLVQFRRWHDAWVAAAPPDPAAAVLATVGPGGRPSARYVNVVRVDTGFVFFTGHRTRKATDLAANPAAALCFGWLGHDRQVRAEGDVARLPDAECDERFAALPREVQLVLWASDGRSVVDGRTALAAAVADAAARFEGGDVTRPPDWGGYRLVPDVVEVWEGRADHLHERARYRRRGTGWALERVAP